jgi:hypothetical protein
MPKIYFANCGDGPNRKWQDCARLGFMAAGQGKIQGTQPGYFSNQLRKLRVGDILAAYFTAKGYVGIGRVTTEIMDIDNAILNKEIVTPKMFTGDMFENADNEYKERLVAVEWISPCVQHPRGDGAFWWGGPTPRNIIATLENKNRRDLRIALQKRFAVDFSQYIPNYQN